MATVGGYSADEVDALTVDFQQLVMRSIQTSLDKTAAALPTAIVSAGALSADDAHAVTHAWEEEVDGVLTPYIAQVYTGSATSIALGTATAFPNGDLPGVPLLPDDFALTYMKSRVNTLYNVSDELWEDVRNELIDGIQNGSSTQQVAAKIKLLGQFNQNEAERIARTEMHSAVESGNHAQMVFMGFTDDEVEKVWEYTHDGRTRPTHVAAGGQRRKLNEQFNVGGSHLLFPGDPGGAANEIVHCRCTVTYDFDVEPPVRCGGQLVAATSAPNGTACVVPLHAADISHIPAVLHAGIFNFFMSNKISPAYGGAKIHKVVQLVREDMKAGTAEMKAAETIISDRQIVAIVDKYYVGKGTTFTQKYDEWLVSPAGKKVVPNPGAHGIVTPAAAPPPPVLTPVATPYTPKILSPPTNHKFTILDDPGPSGDGTHPSGYWGLYGSSGVLTRAYDADGVARFLLIQRGEKYIGSQKFKWQLPGGGLDKHEGPYEGAAREFWEETAAPKEYVESMQPVGEFVFDPGGGWKYTTIGAHSDKGVFVPKVHGSTGDAQWFTIEQLQQMVDNGDIIKELTPTLMKVADDLNHMAPPHNPAMAAVTPDLVPKLPPIVPKPDVADLEFTGKTLGSHGAQVWRDKNTGDKWLFKPQQPFLTDLDVGMAKLQSKALQTRPGIYKMTLNGKQGSLQYMFSSKEAFPHGSFDIHTLSDDDIFVMQREQIFDWMISNYDTHSGQWIRLTPSGQLYGTDKGQAFKFFGHDKLDWDYVPVTPLGQDKLTYTKMWKDYVKGGTIDLKDPTTGRLGEFLDRLAAIDDKTYKDLLRPYASQVKSGAALEKFLDDAVARKNNLRKDFEAFWLRAQTERAKHVNVPTPSVPTPSFAPVTTGVPPPGAVTVPLPPGPVTSFFTGAPTAGAVGAGDLGAIPASWNWALKQHILDEWTKIGGGKKVTPAWGGSKIWKQLAQLKVQMSLEFTNVGLPAPNELQLIRVLDDLGGFKGKPKTYESVLTEWLDTAAGKKAVPNVPESLKKVPIVTTTTTPVTTPIVSPVATVVSDPVSVGFVYGSPLKTINAAHDLIIAADVGDTVLYGTGGVGSQLQYKVVKANSSAAYKLFTRFDPASTYGQNDPSGNVWKLFVTTPHKSKLGGITWYDAKSAVFKPGPSFKLAPSKIPGKGPGDAITLDEMEASKWVWNDGDVIAEVHTGVYTGGSNYTYRMISEGNGEMSMWSKGPFDHDFVKNPNVHGTNDTMDFLVKTPLGSNPNWKLTNDVLLPAQKASNVADANVFAGDVLSPAQIMSIPTKDAYTPGFAYAKYKDNEYRIIQKMGGQRTIEFKSSAAGLNSWIKWEDISSLEALEDFGTTHGKLKWYAANADGSMPDIVKVTIPGKSVTGVVNTAANKAGFSVGEAIHETDIMNSHYDNPVPGSVIAQGFSSNGTHWKIVYQTDDQLHAMFIDAGGDYVDAGPVFSADEIPTLTSGWKASAEHITPMSATPVNASVMPGKIAGAHVTPSEVWNNTSGSDAIAYTFDDIHGDIWKLTDNPDPNFAGTKALYAKGGGYSPNGWAKLSTMYSHDDFANSNSVKTKTWYAAKANGDPPDELLIAMANKGFGSGPGAPHPPPTLAPAVAKKAAKAAKAAKATVASKPPGVYVAGKVKGDKVGPKAIWDNWQQYPDGQILAIKPKSGGYWSTPAWRLMKIDGKLVQQKQTNAGVWTQTKIVENQWDIEYTNSWELADDVLSPADQKKYTKAVDKIIAKKAAPPPPKVAKKAASPSYSSSYSSYSTPTPSYVAPHVDITPWNQTEQREIFDYFRAQGVYTSASPDSMWGATQSTKYYFQNKYGGKYTKLNELELLRIMDEQRALKKGIANDHWYEGKVMNWLQTPAGKSYVNRKIDAPIAAVDVPIPMEDFAAGGDFDKQTYPVLTSAQSLKNREDSHAKYGGWKTGEKSALKDYTGGVSGSWNSAIRKGDLGSYKAKILAAQNGMRPSVRPMILHRGTDFTEFNDPSINSSSALQAYVGTTYINRGFNSASFGGRAGFSSKKVILEIECPIGTPMSHANDYSNFPSENEVTLATHLVYRILSVKDSGSQTIVRVRVIGVGQP